MFQKTSVLTLITEFPSINCSVNHMATSVSREARRLLYSSGLGLERPSRYLKKQHEKLEKLNNKKHGREMRVVDLALQYDQDMSTMCTFCFKF